jgi:hypothetical protein
MVMSKMNIQTEGAPLSNIEEQKRNSKIMIAKISECLSLHEQCSGTYIDTVTGDYVIRCSCSCHKLEKSNAGISCIDNTFRNETSKQISKRGTK